MDSDEVDVDETLAESEEERDVDEAESDDGVDRDDADDNSEEEEEDDDDDDEDEDEDDDDDEGDDDDDEGNSMRRPAATSPSRRRSPTPQMSTSPTAYLNAARDRRRAILEGAPNIGASSYLVEPVGAAPHSAHIHSMAMSGDGTNLLTGGGDGHIRRFDVYASMNGKTLLTQNVRHQYVDGIVRGGTMTAWWANEEYPVKRKGRNGYVGRENGYNGDEDDDDSRDGERLVSPVHSLAVQQDALWCLSGLSSGNINLYSLRHDSGGLRHILRRHKSAVSAMALGDDDASLVSGGWDRDVHQWDLNTGQVVRSFPGHTGQISSLSFRPLQSGETYSLPTSPIVSIRASASPTKGNHLNDTMQPSHATGSNGERHQHDTAMASPVAAPQEDADSKRSPKHLISTGHDTAPAQVSAMKHEVLGASSNTPSKDGGDYQTSPLFSDKMDIEGDLNDALRPDESEKAMPFPTIEEDVSLAKPEAPGQTKNKGDDSDGDSLFGGASADGEEDADAEGEDVDADGEADAEGEDDDATGEEDDQPLAALAAVRPSAGPGLELPGISQGTTAAQGANGTREASEKPKETSSGEGEQHRQKNLPKPAFGTSSIFASYDADTSVFSNDILLSSTLGGQVALWDRRIPSYPSGASGSGSSSNNGIGAANNGNGIKARHKGVRSLPLPEKTPPWCMSACWSSRGDKIYIGRRNETVDEWDLRMLPENIGTDGSEDGLPPRLQSSRRGNARFVRSLRFPAGSGPVSSVLGMPNGRHLVCASFDNVRIWDTAQADSTSGIAGGYAFVPFRIVAGHHGGTISQMAIDPTARFLFTASGDRGWYSTSTESVIMHEVRGTI